jgi:hypothetical protein
MRNKYQIEVKECCASCQHRVVDDEGTRICQLMQLKVPQKFVCPKWKMSDALKTLNIKH